MKANFKFYLGSAFFIAIASFLIGYLTIQSWQTSEYQRIDRELQTSIDLIVEEPGDKLQAALFAADDSELSLSVVFIGLDGSLNLLVDSKAQFPSVPSPSELDAATSKAITVFRDAPVRMRVVALEDNEFILIGTSIQDLVEAKSNNIRSLIFFVILIVAVGSLIQTFIIRRNLRFAQLQQTVEVEREFNRKMQDFIGDASHELRTPLTVIKGYVELLSQTQSQKTEPQTKAFLRLDSEIKRMEALINDLLLITELTDTSEISEQQLDLTQMINQSVEDLQVLQPDRPIDLQAQRNININGDISLISQLLANMFSNIARHTPIDARVKVTLSRVIHQAVLQVEDGGPGLPPQFYSEGIQHFQRFDKSRSRESGGSGLGMSIMRAIVEKHGGTIELGPSTLGGLSITVTLPSLSL